MSRLVSIASTEKEGCLKDHVISAAAASAEAALSGSHIFNHYRSIDLCLITPGKRHCLVTLALLLVSPFSAVVP